MNRPILIVDDSLTVRMDLVDAFTAAGFPSLPCATAAEARLALANGPVALVILDVLLPDADGVGLLQELHALPAMTGVPVLMLSTEAEVKDRVRGLQTGADDYVGKPYEIGYVVARARELISASRTAHLPGSAAVLVVDDSPTFREELRAALMQVGYTVLLATTGEEGLRMVASQRPSAILVDGMLPGIDGATVIRRLRLDSVMRGVPCVLMTASEDVGSELQALDAGADAFVRKDDDIEVILARLAAVLRQGVMAPAEGATSLLGPKKILAVDDSQTYLQALASTLLTEGYDVVLARSGEEALELLGVQVVDCILLDLQMPGLSGQETCRRIKAVPSVRDIPLIMLTAREDRAAMIEGLGAGADDYISKSSEFEVLKARVRAQIRRKQFEDEHRRMREELLRKELDASEARAARELAETRARLVEELEARVQDRTAALAQTAKSLEAEIADHKSSEVKLQAQLTRLDLLSQITRAIGERQDLPSIFQVVIRSLEDHLPIDFGCICVYDPVANTLTVTSVGIQSEALAMELAMSVKASIPIDQNGLSRCIAGRLVYEPDIAQVSFPFPQRLLRGGLRSLVAVPLVVESTVFGVLIVARRQPQSFGSGECEFLRQLSDHVALAAHQAQLYAALQQAYDELRQSQHAVMQQERLRALGQMASGIAHDINNAISPIGLYTDMLLQREKGLSDRGRQQLETINRAIDDVAHTVKRLGEFYRQQEAHTPLAPVDANEMVKQIMDLTRAKWSDLPQQRGVVIQTRLDLAPELPRLLAIASEVREALTNLIFNAVDAMPEGGTLTVRTQVVDAATSSVTGAATRFVHIEVQDTGTGMTEEARKRCLEPFFTTKGERGTGLGLAMVYGILQRHHADIDIESVFGQGTTMRLRFPVRLLPHEQPTESVPQRPAIPLRILLIDDDPVILKSLRDVLAADGHQVVIANGGREGVDMFKTAHQTGTSPAVVVTDLGMPYVDGRQVASAIKGIAPTVPVILLTGWGQRLIADGDIPPHVDCVLSKPPKLHEVRAALALLCSPDRTPPSP